MLIDTCFFLVKINVYINSRNLNKNFPIYRAEELNQQIEEYRGELADYNMVLERLNTASSSTELKNDFSDLKLKNEQETKSLDLLFIEKGK